MDKSKVAQKQDWCPNCGGSWTYLGSPSLDIAYSWCSNCGSVKQDRYRVPGDPKVRILRPKLVEKEAKVESESY